MLFYPTERLKPLMDNKEKLGLILEIVVLVLEIALEILKRI